ncbi:hypothetical protein AOQ84DRAFT_116079 [Glonium stellatum]|uniref:Zn(2)-C6 fungal-type domain-containing protein n=1 Tax=Glonium stellatum TaxID=574774 RepID=A0A8E2JP63_9PEZI|nr:hypothetical protein AOQ84DRAFT_116079 [Glonium stellatum]
MPSVAQGPLTNGVDFVHKDKVGEPLISGFTAVNGRGSPPQAHKTNGANGTNGMNNDTIHVRPLSQQSPDETQDRKVPVSQKDDWRFASPNGNGARVVTPPSSYSRDSVESTENRKRSSPDDEEENTYHPHDTNANQPRRRVDTYDSAPRDESPNTIHHGLPMSIEHPLQHSYQSVNGERSDRNWQTREAVGTMNESQLAEALQRESRSMESPSGGAEGSPEDSSMAAGGDMQNTAERSSTTEITRAGVQVDPKKRKRQFANRTKTGCQTCRRRKKKCDEAKPECSNCLRGGFICEGYANKATWTKPSISKGHVPLQAKDSFSEQSTLYHRHGHAREGYVNPNQPPPPQIDGGRTRPIVVEEHDRQPARNPWGNPWPENHHRPYTQEHSQAPEYSHPPPMAGHPRPTHPGHPGEYEHPGPAAIAQRPPAPQPYNHTQNVQK